MMYLARTEETANITRKFYIENLDNPDYKYYFFEGWVDLPKIEDIGWNMDYLEIKDSSLVNETIGLMSYKIDRANDLVSDLAFCLLPAYRKKGLGEKAFDVVLTYLLVKRNFRKVSFSTIIDNTSMRRMLDGSLYSKAIRHVGVKKAHIKLVDNRYYDVVSYEIVFKTSKE